MKVGILGSGAYGLALSHILINNKIDTTIWTPIEEEYQELSQTFFQQSGQVLRSFSQIMFLATERWIQLSFSSLMRLLHLFS